jgi:hypothetical protein
MNRVDGSYKGSSGFLLLESLMFSGLRNSGRPFPGFSKQSITRLSSIALAILLVSDFLFFFFVSGTRSSSDVLLDVTLEGMEYFSLFLNLGVVNELLVGLILLWSSSSSIIFTFLNGVSNTG